MQAEWSWKPPCPRGICEKKTFLASRWKTSSFDHSGGCTARLQYPQPPVSRRQRGRQCLREPQAEDGRLGVFWHTPGESGKETTLYGLSGAEKMRRKFAGSPTIVVLTDRDRREPTDRRYSGENCGLLGKTKASPVHCISGTDLVKSCCRATQLCVLPCPKVQSAQRPPITDKTF